MGGFSTTADDPEENFTVMSADNACWDGTRRDTLMDTNGQLWIGAAAAPHVRPNTLTAGTGITIVNGEGEITLSANGQNDLHVSQYIVSSSGTVGTGANYTSIQSAIDAAAAIGSAATVFVMPGTYNENLTFKDQISVTSFFNGSFSRLVKITGNHTMAAGSCLISGVNFTHSSGTGITVSDAARLYFYLCDFYVSNNATMIAHSGTGQVGLNYCTGDVSTTGSVFITNSGSGKDYIIHSRFTSGLIDSNISKGANLISGTGTLSVLYSIFPFQIETSGAGGCFIDTVQMNFANLPADGNVNFLVLGGSGNNICYRTYFGPGTNSAVTVNSTATISECTFASLNTNAIDGAGTLYFSNLNFQPGTSTTISTTTQYPIIVSNEALNVVTPGAYPYSVKTQDTLVKVDTSVARTLNLQATPITGQKHIIKDVVGSAAANNITITPAAGNIDGAASYTITTNYGSVQLVYTGTEWSII